MREVLQQAVEAQLPLLDSAEELAAAKASPGGTWLSPAAQAIYEKEGASRFAKNHSTALRRYILEYSNV
jgi:hypothetical protein